MTARALPEWIGKTPDTAPPKNVRERVFLRQDGRCAACTRKLGVAGERWECDHVVALVNGGQNRDGNLQALCRECHRGKTDGDVAEKSSVSRKRRKHVVGERKKSRFATSRDGPFKQRVGGRIERRET